MIVWQIAVGERTIRGNVWTGICPKWSYASRIGLPTTGGGSGAAVGGAGVLNLIHMARRRLPRRLYVLRSPSAEKLFFFPGCIECIR